MKYLPLFYFCPFAFLKSTQWKNLKDGEVKSKQFFTLTYLFVGKFTFGSLSTEGRKITIAKITLYLVLSWFSPHFLVQKNDLKRKEKILKELEKKYEIEKNKTSKLDTNLKSTEEELKVTKKVTLQ